MKRKILTILGAALMLAALTVLSSCGQDDPYEDLAKDGYSVCVRYDANGGDFACNGTYISIVDVYHTSEDSIKLFPPDSEIREPKELRYDVQRSMSSYRFAGWFQAATNDKGEVIDEDGNPVSVSGKEPKFISDEPWDFNQEYKLDKNKTYSRDVPAITLCAKWDPHYTFEFYIEDENGNWVNFTKKNKNGETEKLVYKGIKVQLPNIVTGIRDDKGYGNWYFYNSYFNPTECEEFPIAHTIKGMYLTPECTEDSAIPLTAVDSPNFFNGDEYYAANPSLDFREDPIKIYTKWEEGNWFYVTDADQFTVICASILDGTLDNVKIRIMNDLDFGYASEYGWVLNDPRANIDESIDYATFEGFDIYVEGNLHTFKNVTATDYIFKKLAASAVIKDLTIESPAQSLAEEIADGALIDNVNIVANSGT